MNFRNGPLIQILMDALQRKYEQIERAKLEIISLKQELLDLGVELPPE